MLEITFRGLDEIGNQIVPSFELHVDLRISVFVTVAQRDQRVVRADDQHDQRDSNQNDDDEKKQSCAHSVSFRVGWPIARRKYQRRQMRNLRIDRS